MHFCFISRNAFLYVFGMKLRVAIIIAGILFGFNLSAQDEFTRAKEGQEAPDFVYHDIDGATHHFSDLSGKVVWLTFFATWCGPCRKELPHLEQEVYEKYKNHPNFKLLVIGREHTAGELKKFRIDTGHDLPFIPDPEREIFEKYAAQNIPRNFIIDQAGTIAVSSVGFNEDDFNEKVKKLNELLNK